MSWTRTTEFIISDTFVLIPRYISCITSGHGFLFVPKISMYYDCSTLDRSSFSDTVKYCSASALKELVLDSYACRKKDSRCDWIKHD